MQPERPPRDQLVRAVFPGVEYRAADDDSGLGTLVGHFAVFNQWTEINSIFEGHFMERIAPGAFGKTFVDQRDSMRVTFQHGKDPALGHKVLGPITELREDETGGYYEVPLLDTSYNRDLVPGLRAGLYGSSFTFRVVKEDFDTKAKRSVHNPDGIPERTVREAQVFEFGPVTYPAYANATAGVRSMTDDYLLGRLLADPQRFVDLLERARIALPSDEAEAEPHSDEGSRTTPVAFKPISRDDFVRSKTNGNPRPR
jgi:HK97 family phage prohead protease